MWSHNSSEGDQWCGLLTTKPLRVTHLRDWWTSPVEHSPAKQDCRIAIQHEWDETVRFEEGRPLMWTQRSEHSGHVERLTRGQHDPSLRSQTGKGALRVTPPPLPPPKKCCGFPRLVNSAVLTSSSTGFSFQPLERDYLLLNKGLSSQTVNSSFDSMYNSGFLVRLGHKSFPDSKRKNKNKSEYP